LESNSLDLVALFLWLYLVSDFGVEHSLICFLVALFLWLYLVSDFGVEHSLILIFSGFISMALFSFRLWSRTFSHFVF
jgi:multisubunit Na+/H+ antiporter MnhE subunit